MLREIRGKGRRVVQPFQRPVFLLTTSDEMESMLRQVLHQPFLLRRVRDWAELRSALVEATPSALCFMDAVTGNGAQRGLSERVREVVHEFPHVPVVACLAVDPVGDVEKLIALQSWGVAEVLDSRREHTATALVRRLETVKSVWAHRLFEAVLPRSLSTRGRVLLGAVADVAAEGGHVPELARRLGIDERTVPRWCASAGVPNARRLFSWIRLLFAADLLDRSAHSVEFIARQAGYSSAASLKSTTKQFTTFTPTDLRARQAFETVSELVRAELRKAQDALQGSRKRNTWFN